jgi:hypothetical protein
MSATLGFSGTDTRLFRDYRVNSNDSDGFTSNGLVKHMKPT